MLISNSIKDRIINHDEFLEILKEKKDYDCLKNEDVYFFFFYLINITMVFTTAESYKNVGVHVIQDNENYFWVKMKDIQNGLS